LASNSICYVCRKETSSVSLCFQAISIIADDDEAFNLITLFMLCISSCYDFFHFHFSSIEQGIERNYNEVSTEYESIWGNGGLKIRGNDA
jgi:hypothetical protein